jgi:type VI secretion system protein ImpB
VAEQVEPLRRLVELRRQLSDLRGSLQGNDKLEEILQATLHDQEALGRLKHELEPQEAADVN